VNCYKSNDFASWTYIGAVLSPIAGTNISSASVVERPKVLYNDKNQEYVMWFHSDSSNYGAAMVGVATSKTIDGMYTWRGSFKPFGNDSRDMTVWKDDDGTAYLVFATTNNANLQIASLDADYYNVSKSFYVWSSVYWEAPGIFKINGTYFLLYSRQDGWTPTDDYYMTATSMSGPWSSPVLLAAPGTHTYNTQNAYDIVIHGTNQTLYMYYGDHWDAPNLGASSYSFLPVVFDGTSLSLHQTGGWAANLATGDWYDLPYKLYTVANSTASNPENILPCSTCPGGLTLSLSLTGSMSFIWNGTAGIKMLGIQYVYAGANNAWHTGSAYVDGVHYPGLALMETTQGLSTYLEAPVPVFVRNGSNVTVTQDLHTGIEIRFSGVKVYNRCTSLGC